MKLFLTRTRIKRVSAVLLTVSVTLTSFGGALGSIALAAAPASDVSDEAPDTKQGGVAALALLGLVALAAGHGHGDSQSTQPSGGTTATAGAQSTGSSSSNGTTSATTGSVPSTTTSANSIQAAEQQAVSLMNADRKANGLAALTVDSRLTVLSEKYAQDMIARNFFSHTNPEGQSPFDRMKAAGISYSSAGENIAINQNVAAAEVSFMNSSGHRANILNSAYTQVGIGVAYDAKGSAYVVQEFIGK